MKNQKAVLFFVIVLGALLVLPKPSAVACNAPARPSKVPKTAIWVGGCDGGSWIKIDRVESSRAKLSIFEDHEGKELKASWFAFSSGCEVSGKAELEETFSVYDGEMVILNKRDPSNPDRMCAMKAIK